MYYISFQDAAAKLKQLQLQGIEKLIYNNDRYISDSNTSAFILALPKIDELSKTSIYTITENGIDYSKQIGINVPSLVLYKTILAYRDNEYICIYNDDNKFITKNSIDITNMFHNILEIIDTDIQKLYRIAYEIQKLVTHIDFFISYKLIECIDKLLTHCWYYIMFLQDLSAASKMLDIQPDSKLTGLNQNISHTVKNLLTKLEQTRHATMQRISYLDSGTSRILTIIASLFLPASFLVALFSMPFKDMPMRNNTNAFMIFLTVIITIFIILSIVFRKDFMSLITY
jgi:Mg2+ and Co2+ transporter CorA